MTAPTDMGGTPEWLTLRQGAEATGKSIRTMRRWATNGKVGARKSEAGVWLVRKADLFAEAPQAQATAEISVLSAELVAMRETFHTLADDLATARERAGRAEAERDALANRIEELQGRRWWQSKK